MHYLLCMLCKNKKKRGNNYIKKHKLIEIWINMAPEYLREILQAWRTKWILWNFPVKGGGQKIVAPAPKIWKVLHKLLLIVPCADKEKYCLFHKRILDADHHLYRYLFPHTQGVLTHFPWRPVFFTLSYRYISGQSIRSINT